MTETKPAVAVHEAHRGGQDRGRKHEPPGAKRPPGQTPPVRQPPPPKLDKRGLHIGPPPCARRPVGRRGGRR